MSVIFSIDNESNPVIRAAFVAFVSSLPLIGGFRQCFGVYKGQGENAFMMDTGDFNAFVKGSDWVKNQESFLYVASGNKQEATLYFPANGEKLALGCMHNVDREEALALGDYTFRFPDEYFPKGAYFVAREGNPDW
jgi:hypothetical protein